jgi:hypothetical protein
MNFKQWLILSETITVKDQEFRDPLNALKHIQATHPNPENLVVTFTAIDKVGINPKSPYKTPFGIYFYPLDYVIHKEMDVEFAGNQPYLNVCEFARPEKILHMIKDNTDFIKRMLSGATNQKGLELLNVFPQEEVELAKQQLKLDTMKNIFHSDYSELWLVTKQMAEKRASVTLDKNNKKTTNEAVLWNANLRKCGIDGFLDHGTGTIHGNEPTQGVVFTANSLKRILVIPQTLFSKQGKIMPVRKSLPSLDRIPLNQLENLLKTRNLSDNDFHYLLAFAPNRDEMARLIVQHVKELSGDNINSLIGVVSDKDEMARLIIQHIKELSGDIISVLLSTASDVVEMARILGLDNINKLNGGHVKNLLHNAPDKEKMREILGSDNINKLTGDDVKNLMAGTNNTDEMARILGRENINKLSGDHVAHLLGDTTIINRIEKMAEILGSDNINKLTGNHVKRLFQSVSEDIKNYILQMLANDYTGKDSDIRFLIYQMETMEIKKISSQTINKHHEL